MARVCVFGLGEAGSEIAADLVAAGAAVAGFDPAPVATPKGVRRHDDPCAAVVAAEAVLGITAAADSRAALEQALSAIPRGSHYADFSTASPELKRSLSATAAVAGLGFTDVALMGTVPGKGIKTPALASGPGAAAFAEYMIPLGMDVAVVGSEPGLAATHKLLRSVVVKGLTAVVIESMRAAAAAGLAAEAWGNIVDQIEAADESFLRRLVAGTGTHAQRRLAEMQAAAALLADLGVSAVMTGSTVANLEDVIANGIPKLPDEE